MTQKREYVAGRDFLGGNSAQRAKRAEEIVEQKFGSVDAVIDADPELRAMRDKIAAEAANSEFADKPRRGRRPRKTRVAA